MRVAILVLILGLAAASQACGGGAAPDEGPEVTESPKETVAAPTPTWALEQEAIGRLTSLLREANVSHYTVGCAYRDDYGQDDLSVEDVLEGLSVKSSDGASWAVGEVVGLDSSSYLITVSDVNSEGTGASSFWRTDDDGRFCLVPKVP